MHHGRNAGKKLMAITIIRDTLEIIHLIANKKINKKKKLRELFLKSKVSRAVEKRLNINISSNLINQLYDIAIKAGAYGGKICGAGGGGFLMIVAEEKYHTIPELKNNKAELSEEESENKWKKWDEG